MEKPLRLLFVSHSFPPIGRPLANMGGMQRVATELHGALERHSDVDVRSALLRTSWHWTHLKTLPFLVKVYQRIQQCAADNAIDAVLFSSMVTAATAPFLHARLASRNISMAAIVHGRDVTLPFWPYQRFAVPRIFASLDTVLPVSQATGRACLDRGLPGHKVKVVPNGVDTDRFTLPDDRHAARHRLLQHYDATLPEDALLLCSVGRQVERKGFAWFVSEVMPLLPDNVHYWLAGEGPQDEAIRAAAHRKGLEKQVRLLGRIPDAALELLYRGADLFMMPNVPVAGDMEGFGVVMLEAGLSGLPVIAARLEGIQDVVDEGRNGHLVPSGDAEAFRRAIMPYYENRSRLHHAALRAARYTADRFSWTAVANHYVQALQSLVHRPALEVPA